MENVVSCHHNAKINSKMQMPTPILNENKSRTKLNKAIISDLQFRSVISILKLYLCHFSRSLFFINEKNKCLKKKLLILGNSIFVQNRNR